MANNLDTWIPKLAGDWNTKHEKLDNGVTWGIDVPFKLKDGSYRYQWVYISFGVGVAKGNDIYDVRSKVGDYSAKVDLHGLLQEAKYGYHSAVCIRESSREGKQVEVVFVQAGPFAEYVTNYDQMKFIIEEVGANADILEHKFYGGVDKS
jgi:hypothetical protein